MNACFNALMKYLVHLLKINLFVFLASCGTSGDRLVNETSASVPIVYAKDYRIRLMGLERVHPFDIAKYDKIYKSLTKSGQLTDCWVFQPDTLVKDDLLLVHTEDYIASLRDKSKVAVYLESPSLSVVPNWLFYNRVVQPFINASGGTLKAARLAMEHGIAINLGGGYHHAKPASGEGFCLIADVPIAIRKLQHEKKIQRALIVDTDIHQGNGTIRCLVNDKSTYCFSIHEAGIYPQPKEKGDWDVELPAGVTDEAYLAIFKKCLESLFTKSKPDIVFHVAGCDALAGDPLANGEMSEKGILERDLMLMNACKKHGVPYVMTLAGGYSKNAWRAQAESIKAIMRSWNKKS